MLARCRGRALDEMGRKLYPRLIRSYRVFFRHSAEQSSSIRRRACVCVQQLCSSIGREGEKQPFCCASPCICQTCLPPRAPIPISFFRSSFEPGTWWGGGRLTVLSLSLSLLALSLNGVKNRITTERGGRASFVVARPSVNPLLHGQ